MEAESDVRAQSTTGNIRTARACDRDKRTDRKSLSVLRNLSLYPDVLVPFVVANVASELATFLAQRRSICPCQTIPQNHLLAHLLPMISIAHGDQDATTSTRQHWLLCALAESTTNIFNLLRPCFSHPPPGTSTHCLHRLLMQTSYSRPS